MIWDVKAGLRGRQREFQLELVSYDPPNGMRFNTKTAGVDGVMTVELIALSRSSTRLNLRLELTPANLTGRLLLQSLKLARGSIANRVNSRLHEYARTIEDRVNGSMA